METATLGQSTSNISPNILTLMKIWFKRKIYSYPNPYIADNDSVDTVEDREFHEIRYEIAWVNMVVQFNPEWEWLNWYMVTYLWDTANNVSLKIQSLDDLDRLLTILQIKHITIL